MTGDYKDPISRAIDGAEDICDPLEGLIEKTATNPGAAFRPEVLKGLASLKKDDPAAFEVLRAKLKKKKCRVSELDVAIAEESGDAGGRSPKPADVLVKIAKSAGLFHVPDKTGFADIDIDGHRETWRIRSQGFRRWLVCRFYEETQGVPNSEALQSALNVIEAKADFDAPERVVHVRIGGHDGKLYLDLCNEAWQAVEIDPRGWRVIDTPPVRFRRAAGMKQLPIPLPGGSIDELRGFLNVKSHQDFVLVVTFLLAALRDRGPYPVIALSGEQGSAKSTFCAILKALLDPSTAPLRALPREERDLFISATNGHILAFDNVSGLPLWVSDMFCRLSTGGSFAVRQLYTDQEEVLFDAVRPVILNGIEEIITKPDLADRALFLTLEPIPEERRRPEQELWTSFQAAHPRILGTLLDAVVHGLATLPQTRLERLPRLADFALWATACETSIWPVGTFRAAYCRNRDEAVDGVLDSDPVAVAVRTLIDKKKRWTGTAAELLSALGVEVGEPQARSKEWPASARALSGRLRRAATFLRKVGIEIEFVREGRARTRTIQISSAPETGDTPPTAQSASSANAPEPNGGSSLVPHPTRTVANQADDKADHDSTDRASSVRANPLGSSEMTAADGVDANLRPHSAQGKNGAAAWKVRL